MKKPKKGQFFIALSVFLVVLFLAREATRADNPALGKNFALDYEAPSWLEKFGNSFQLTIPSIELPSEVVVINPGKPLKIEIAKADTSFSLARVLSFEQNSIRLSKLTLKEGQKVRIQYVDDTARTIKLDDTIELPNKGKRQTTIFAMGQGNILEITCIGMYKCVLTAK